MPHESRPKTAPASAPSASHPAAVPSPAAAPSPSAPTAPAAAATPSAAHGAPGATWPVLWRVFAANTAVFVVAVALLVLTPLEIHKRIRVDELAVLLAGLVAMLAVDLVLTRRALQPLARLARLMGTVDLRRPGQRASGFERSGAEVAALAGSFNEMLARLEDERRASAARALAAQEAERRRIARELHDEVGQSLTAVVMRAEHVASRASGDRAVAELGELAGIVKGTLVDIRRISRELRPEALDDLGLANALTALCNRVAESARIGVGRRIQTPLPALSAGVELAVYRVAQESLNNVVRHAHASRADLSLAVQGDHLVLIVADDGVGLGAPQVDGGGLSGMRERAILIGARLEVEAARDGGTVVTLCLPFEAVAR